jgi:hypothetical protein
MWVLLALALGLCGCATAIEPGDWQDPQTLAVTGDGDGDGDGDPVPPAPACDAPELVFKLQDTAGGCSGGSCHGGVNGVVFQPDLVSDGVATRLIGVVATGPSCAGHLYIDPTNIAASLILTKLISPPACGLQMPLGQSPLDQTKIDCVRSWIESVVAAQ